jgi:hypothetical protein
VLFRSPASIDWPEGQEHALDSGEWSAHFEARIAAGAGMGAVLELRPLEDWKRPDLLVYWSETEAEAPGPASTLIGKLAGTQRRRFALPLAASIAPGWITVFSLGHQETVFHAALAPPELQPWWASIGYDLSPDTDR